MDGVFKALSDPTRRRVLQLLRKGPRSAGEMSEQFPVSKPTMSAHFAVLQNAGLIESEKTGRTITYRLKMSVLEDALLGFTHTLGWRMKAGAREGTGSKAHENSRQELRGLKEEG
jgi:DNA-binding transcriptional ArsR family regulator